MEAGVMRLFKKKDKQSSLIHSQGTSMATRLSEFSIHGLFGLYSHRIAFNLDQHITIIIGPNGIGKTVCLKFIEAFFQRNFFYIRETDFESAAFSFSDGHKILISSERSIPENKAKHSTENSITFTLQDPLGKTFRWAPAVLNRDFLRKFRSNVSENWEQIGPDLWVDTRDGEEITLQELNNRYRFTSELKADLSIEWPKNFASLLEKVGCYLIEAQRLLVISQQKENKWEERYSYDRNKQQQSNLAIRQKAEKLKAILEETFKAYATRSQNLERSFPLRLFESQFISASDETELRDQLKTLDERRAELMISGLLNSSSEVVTLQSGKIDQGVAKALEIYVRDTKEKLDVFNDVKAKLDLFKYIIESRFLGKTIEFDQTNGFRILSETKIDVPIEKLSSGEQHQLILAFDLLFEVKRDSLILIDEPELSLHITWQKSFIDSLAKIISIAPFDVLLATHSPALIARHLDLTVEFGEVDEA